MEEEKKVTQYLIPANVSIKFEFFEGFGWYEFKLVTIACLIGAAIFFGLGLITIIPTILRLFAILIPAIGTFFLVKRDASSGMSLIGILKNAKEFKKKQKLYIYKYASGGEG